MRRNLGKFSLASLSLRGSGDFHARLFHSNSMYFIDRRREGQCRAVLQRGFFEIARVWRLL
jgi:hypothetical protein